MDYCTDLENISNFNQSVLTIGSFDGLHQGHMGIINELKYIAQNKNIPAVAITFDPHPKSILNKGHEDALKVLMGTEQKLKVFEEKIPL